MCELGRVCFLCVENGQEVLAAQVIRRFGIDLFVASNRAIGEVIKEKVARRPHHAEQTALLVPRREGEFGDGIGSDRIAEKASIDESQAPIRHEGEANFAVDSEERKRVAVVKAAHQTLAARIDEDLSERSEGCEVGGEIENGGDDGGI